MLAFVSQWGHAAAAAMFGALMIWLGRRISWDRLSRPMAVACGLTAIWALIVSMTGWISVPSQLAENARNLGWLGFMFSLHKQGQGQDRGLTTTMLYGVIAGLVAMQSVVSMVHGQYVGSPRLLNAIFFAELILRMMFAIGALVLLHNLYTAATSQARRSIRFPMIAMTVMWVYDLNLYTISYLSRGWSMELLSLRGIAIALTAPIVALATMRSERLSMRLSRTATFQSLSLVAIGCYLMVMVAASSAIEFVAGEYARPAQVGFVFGCSVLALVLMPSERFRAWMKVKLAKHLFQHRYDYRSEWVRFNETIGRSGNDAGTLEMRAVQAIADIAEAPGGLLLVPDDHNLLIYQSRWNWRTTDVPGSAASRDLCIHLKKSRRIIELDMLRRDVDGSMAESALVPEWLIAETRAWAMVPLIHFDRLEGVVVLERPAVDRGLDWEDFDLLKVVGQQVASYLAEARSQQALSDVRQFDEFNRRFAFIMHDIKNLVSQLSLVARNAEKYADNPEFRADMIATLHNSASRMNDMLARLSQHSKSKPLEPRPVELGKLVEAVAKPKRMSHPIVTGGDMQLLGVADPVRLEQALTHIVQNAIDASSNIEPVCITIRNVGAEVQIEVHDRGKGMSAHFVRHDLFKAFTSTKDSGFGIGAFEARALINSMGGRVDVKSREGEGTTFNIYIPVATMAVPDAFEPKQVNAA